MESEGSKINYSPSGGVDPTAHEQGLRRAQEEHERKMKELRDKMERVRLQALRDAEERARVEDEEKRKILDMQRRETDERERKLKEEEEFLQLQQELMNYDFHNCPRIKKEAFGDLQVDDIDFIRIALIGPAGSGKTSFIGTLQRAIGEAQSAFEQGTGGEGNIHLEEYYVQKNIRMVDTRGFFARDERLVDECLDILTGRIRPGEEIKRDYDLFQKPSGDGRQEPNITARKARSFSKYAHAVIFVLKANDRRLETGIYKETLTKIRDHFQTQGHSPVTVITWLDKLQTEEDRRKASDMAARATGGAGERTYLISNYINDNNSRSLVVDRTALDILDSALISAESFIRIRKQKENNQMEREAMASGPISGVETVDQFFARLCHKHHWTDQGSVKAVLEYLRTQEINTVRVLKDMWEEIKTDLPLSMGMMKVMGEDIESI